MSSVQQQIPAKVLDDLCSRFIINIPAEQRDDPVRVLFAVELAHWFYIDFYCDDDDGIHIRNIRDFAEQIFQHCPFLRDHVYNLDEIVSQWRGYKLSVPTYGAVLIDPTYEHVLLVRGFCNRESWGFPKGKVQENESPFKCAIREVLEEVGFDMKDRAFEDQYLERDLNGQLVRLYMVKHVPLDTKFAPKTKNEIKEMRWFPIADLPTHRRDIACQANLNVSAKAFFMVIPFIKDIRRWIGQECGMYTSSNGDSDNANDKTNTHFRHHHHQQQYQNEPRRRTATYHGNTHAMSMQQQQQQQHPYNIRDGPPVQRQPKQQPSKIIANLTVPTDDQPSTLPAHVFQKQQSIQDTIQRHFSQILRNDSITVTDNTTITETLLMRESKPAKANALHANQLTPPMSNDDENQYPPSAKQKIGRKSASAARQPQYRILPRGQPDEPTPLAKKSQANTPRQRNPASAQEANQVPQPLSNVTNEPFRFTGPRCWTKFRLNRSEVYRCLQE